MQIKVKKKTVPISLLEKAFDDARKQHYIRVGLDTIPYGYKFTFKEWIEQNVK
jgi:hypothetical protein